MSLPRALSARQAGTRGRAEISPSPSGLAPSSRGDGNSRSTLQKERTAEIGSRAQVRAKVANYTSSDALKAAADHIVQVARAALANKVSSGFPEPANFERELKKWIQATEAAAADMRTRAASSSSEYSPTEQWQDDWKPYDEVAKEPLLLMQEARGLVMFGSVEKPEADPDIELRVRRADSSPTNRDDAAVGTWIFRG